MRAALSVSPSTQSVPARIEWQALNCPACGELLEQDRDGTACTRCQGLLVQRVWAERLLPALGRPMLPPIFQAVPKILGCPACHRAMAAVLCHGVAAWSCPRCRWLFFEGPRSRQLMEPASLPPSIVRELPRPSMLQVFNERVRPVTRRVSTTLQNVLGVFVLAALVVALVTTRLG